MERAKEKAKSYCKEKGYKSEWIKPFLAYIEGYEQAKEDLITDAIETTIDGKVVKVIVIDE